MDPRNGTKAEGEKVMKMFEMFGFHVEMEYNCTKTDIRNHLVRTTKNPALSMYFK